MRKTNSSILNKNKLGKLITEREKFTYWLIDPDLSLLRYYFFLSFSVFGIEHTKKSKYTYVDIRNA